MRRDVFQAIADPTRRQIIGLLSRQTLTLNGIAAHFAVSRPAISKHIKILSQCGLVAIRQRGRERFCEANLTTLQAVSEWTDQFRTAWAGRLNTLDSLLNPQQELAGPVGPLLFSE